MRTCTTTSGHLTYIYFLSKSDISLNQTHLPLHHKNLVILQHIYPWSKTLKSFTMYLPLSSHPFSIKISKAPNLTTDKQYDVQNPSHEYAFGPNSYPHTHTHTYIYTYKLKNALSMILNYRSPLFNTICQTYTRHQNLTLTGTLTKYSQEIARIQRNNLWFRIMLQYFHWQDSRSYSL